MSLEITEVHYDADPKHIIITSGNRSVDCAQPVNSGKWLDGTYGEVVCIYSNQWMKFEKYLCDNVYVYDKPLLFKFKHSLCSSCGVLNALGCCLNTTPANSYAVQDHDDNCVGNAQTP